MLGIVGGCGGAGATSLCAAVVAVAARGSGVLPVLIDLDPVGGGLDVVLGAESESGARWSGLHSTGGRLDPEQLAEGLPRWQSVPFLACDGHVAPDPLAVRSVLRAAREIGPIVVDLGRTTTPARSAALEWMSVLVIVVPSEIRAVTAAAATLAAAVDDGFTGPARVVVREDSPVVGARRIAEVLDLGLAGTIAPDRGLRAGRDRGIDPRRFRRGTRSLAGELLVWSASAPDRAIIRVADPTTAIAVRRVDRPDVVRPDLVRPDCPCPTRPCPPRCRPRGWASVGRCGRQRRRTWSGPDRGAGVNRAVVRSEPLFDQVRSRLAREGSQDVGAAMAIARREARLLADDTILAEWDHELSARLTGAGPLEPLLELAGVTDVLVNGPDDVWLDRGAGLERADVTFASEADVRALAHRLAVSAGRRLDDAAPFVDAHLPDGTRLHAVIPPLTERTTVSLRVLARRRMELADLIAAGTLSPGLADLIRAVVRARLAFLISGGTGSGKTTVLGVLLGLVAPGQRIVTIEDAAEITTSHGHVVRLLTRSANVEGAGSIGLRDLVRQSLRMRPDRVVVGEFRGAEVVELLAALNTGHAGGGATVHANGMDDVPARLEALGALGGLDRAALTAQAAAALDIVLHLERGPDGRRILAGVGWVIRDGDGLRVSPVWTVDGPGPGAQLMTKELERRGSGDLPAILRGTS